VRVSATLLREPISLLLVAAIVVASVATVAARQGFQTSYQGSIVTTLGASRRPLQTMSRAIAEFESGGIGEDLLRSTLGTSERDTAAALEPLTSMPDLRGTFLDESDAATHRGSRALRAELDELDLSLEQHEALTQVAYRTQRVLGLAAQTGNGLALDSTALPSARRLWLQTYARAVTAYDTELQARTDDLVGWRRQTLPALASAGRWDDMAPRLTSASRDAQLAEDRLRALPTPPEALRPYQDYTDALRHLERALQALTTYATSQAPNALDAADQELAAYRSGRSPAARALAQLAESRSGQ
jgi:hypothetical protein